MNIKQVIEALRAIPPGQAGVVNDHTVRKGMRPKTLLDVFREGSKSDDASSEILYSVDGTKFLSEHQAGMMCLTQRKVRKDPKKTVVKWVNGRPVAYKKEQGDE